MLKQAKQVIVTADASKLGKVSPAFICPTSEIHILITDAGASAEALAPLSARESALFAHESAQAGGSQRTPCAAISLAAIGLRSNFTAARTSASKMSALPTAVCR